MVHCAENVWISKSLKLPRKLQIGLSFYKRFCVDAAICLHRDDSGDIKPNK